MQQKKKIKILVSIIINCRNGEKYLNQALNSVIGQTYDNWELIFFDNFSEDKTKSIVESYNDKRIKYFKNDEQTNLSIARNKAIKLASGDLIAILDHDDWWKKDKLETVIKEFENQKYDFIFSDFYIYYENTKKIKLQKSIIRNELYYSLIKNYNLGLNSMIFSKKLLNDNFFSEKYHIIGDFALVLNFAKNVKWKRIASPLCYYRIHGENESLKKTKQHISELQKWYINDLFLIEKNKTVRKVFLRRILYIKFKYFLSQNNLLYKNYFKKMPLFSIEKVKQIALIIKNFF